jgi:hypothetical protein
MNSSAVKMVACPDCGAVCSQFADKCWLCGRAFGDQARSEIVAAEIASHPPRFALSEWFFAGLTVLLVAVLLLIGLGGMLQEPMLGLTFFILIGPPLLATTLRIRSRQLREGRLGWGQRLSTLLISLSLMIGFVGLLAVASFVAFFVYCLVSVSPPF